MPTLADFPVTKKWPPARPNVLQLYSLGTPNGVKIPIALEEIGLPYEAHKISFDADDHHSAEYLSLNPNNKIPAIIDPNGPDGAPLPLWESGAILLYLADKTRKLQPTVPAEHWETVQWVFFQVGSIGPMFGQVGFFNIFAGAQFDDKRPLERYVSEAKRLLAVLNARLDGRAWIMGDDYTIADVAIFPWVANLIGHYRAYNLVEFGSYANIIRTLDEFQKRPAVQRGMAVYA